MNKILFSVLKRDEFSKGQFKKKKKKAEKLLRPQALVSRLLIGYATLTGYRNSLRLSQLL